MGGVVNHGPMHTALVIPSFRHSVIFTFNLFLYFLTDSYISFVFIFPYTES